MVQQTSIRRIWSFGLLWTGHLVSIVGSGLSGFVLGVWVYRRTGSTTLYALSAVFASLPNILILPFAGALADRWNRRRTMIYCNLSAGLCTLAVALLMFTGRLEVWHIYINLSLLSISSTFLVLVYSASITLLIPKKHFARSSGMNYTANATAQILPPLLAGMLIANIGIPGIILIDFASYFFAIATLLAVHIPMPESTEERRPLLREATFGWNYVKMRPGLLSLMFYFASVNFVVGLARILFFPMILSFTTDKTLGTILSIAGIGFLLGGITMSVWGGPKNRVKGLLGFGLLFGISVLLTGLRPSIMLITVAAFCMHFFIPLVNGCSQAIWQSKTPPDVQGRVFAIRLMIGLSTSPLAYVLAGPLADRFYGPLVAGSEGLRNIVGEGPGRGIGLMFVSAGVLTILAQFVGYLYPRLRRIEEEIPDAIGDTVIYKAETSRGVT